MVLTVDMAAEIVDKMAAVIMVAEEVDMVAEATAVEITILSQVSKENETIVRSSRSLMAQWSNIIHRSNFWMISSENLPEDRQALMDARAAY